MVVWSRLCVSNIVHQSIECSIDRIYFLKVAHPLHLSLLLRNAKRDSKCNVMQKRCWKFKYKLLQLGNASAIDEFAIGRSCSCSCNNCQNWMQAMMILHIDSQIMFNRIWWHGKLVRQYKWVEVNYWIVKLCDCVGAMTTMMMTKIEMYRLCNNMELWGKLLAHNSITALINEMWCMLGNLPWTLYTRICTWSAYDE